MVTVRQHLEFDIYTQCFSPSFSFPRLIFPSTFCLVRLIFNLSLSLSLSSHSIFPSLPVLLCLFISVSLVVCLPHISLPRLFLGGLEVVVLVAGGRIHSSQLGILARFSHHQKPFKPKQRLRQPAFYRRISELHEMRSHRFADIPPLPGKWILECCRLAGRQKAGDFQKC